jgi:hypothetical protein
MNEEVKFKEWAKIPRGGATETITISEKIDGTNACVILNEDGDLLGCQSRNRLIKPGDDNFGFATWAHENAEDLRSLGEGYHYGEWAGPGIQKNNHGYEERKFLLFNTARWNPDNPNRPECCDTVPVLYEGPSSPDVVPEVMDELWHAYQSLRAASGTAIKPEGVVVWFHRGRRFEKHTFENPDGKWLS